MRYIQGETPPRGQYFTGEGTRLPKLYSFEQAQPLLPHPILPDAETWLGCYWYAWKLAFRNAKIPTPQSGFVSDFVDAAFNQDFFLWDTVFITMFADYARGLLPGIAALDNFYAKQLPGGEIAREYVRDTGEDVRVWTNVEGLPLHSYFHKKYGFRMLGKTPPLKPEDMWFPDMGREQEEIAYYTLDALNHPLLAWGEVVSYRLTGDAGRLAEVFPPLVWQYRFMRDMLRHQNGLYVTDWASMDNNPRNRYLGCGIDISCEMVLFADNLLEILCVLEKAGLHPADAELRHTLECDRDTLKARINALMWDDDTGFYYDVKPDGTRAPVKTAAAFWALAAGVADESQAARLAEWLEDKDTFNRPHRLPVLAADEEGYNPNGGYWSGGVWTPMDTMVVWGLERYGYLALARDIAQNHLDAVAEVWKATGTIWENYPADSITSGDADHDDFVGWTGVGPIRFLLCHGVGLYHDAPSGRLVWRPDADRLAQGAVGCKNFRFGGATTTLLLENGMLTATTDKPYTLRLELDGKAREWPLTPGQPLEVTL